ncbi:DUF2304 domain-containing protein [Methanobrevibacter sp.]|uniref:DUF2304 domain-containing protein n=1 Tax=Methanobrevibacter sp. TaxID=66852 RepID=UPI00388D3A35
MLLYSIIFPIISLIAIAWFLYRHLKGKNTLTTVILWTILWIFVIIFSIFPNTSFVFARLFGITRGLDFLIIVVFIVLFYTVVKLYFRLDETQDQLNTIVKELALKNEITPDEEEE